MAEHWLNTRPRGAPEPTLQIRDFIRASREEARSSQRFRRIIAASIFTLLVGIILGLIAWINQSYIAGQWRWWTTDRPFLAANFWPYVLTAESERALKPDDPNNTFRECKSKDIDKDYCPAMIVVPAGSFLMGSPSYLDEKPQHQVTFARPFAVSKYAVTFDEWDTCVRFGDCPQGGDIGYDSGWGRGQRPVINVTPDDAQKYVAWLSRVTGKSYRLPSEAEYEYAARAGTTTLFPWGDTVKFNGKVMANCSDCGSQWDGKQTAPVGSFPPNEFGLYDMVGNIWEWTQDCPHGPYLPGFETYDGAPTDGSAWISGGDCNRRLMRGGSWYTTSDDLQTTMRMMQTTDHRGRDIGFRVARSLIAP